ncbi:MAG: AAA-like domain-containing protein [Eubacteriales bacterium]|nr:AAA-like domain-containing protein [Eubacteriales bacterium]
MRKIFNVTGECKPELHYMVDISEKLRQIKVMVDAGQYFTINRARQYGKTTTLAALERFLGSEYYVVSLDFQYQMSDAKFRNENTFSVAFAKAFISTLEESGSCLPEEMKKKILMLKTEITEHKEEIDLVELFQYLCIICGAADKPIVLMIDEIDSATNNQVFLDFLAQLRGYYMKRDKLHTFQSVILAGVYDVKNIKRKIRPDDEHRMNSPWNIAADFDVVMSFSGKEIAGMLLAYEKDNHTGMDIEEIAGLIYDYTEGYPYLVSRICKLIDEKITGTESFADKKSAWTMQGFLEAVRILLSEKNTLFESLIGKIEDYPTLRKVLYHILFGGIKMIYNPDDSAIDIATMFGFVKNDAGTLRIANRIYETRLYNYYLAANEAQSSEIFITAANNKSQFICNGHLDMDMVMKKYVEYFDSIYGDQMQEFDEDEGRRRFLLYIRPIINGTGNYYIEPQTRNARRMDVVVDYLGERFVIELKIWRGNSYNSRGEKQLSDYLDYFNLKKGYMLSYNFNKKKRIGVHKIQLGEKVLVEAVV